MGFRNRYLNTKIANSILNEIIFKVLLCCEMMLDNCKRENIMIENHEEDIRDYLFINYLDNDDIIEELGIHNFIFVPEVPEDYLDNKPKGRIDLKVLNKDTFKHRKNYFTIEFKRIDGEMTLNRAYLKHGVQRFLGETKPHYPSYHKRNCMFGFVVKEIDIDSNTKTINKLQKHDYQHFNILSEIVSSKIDSTFPFTYISSYKVNNDELYIHHVFYDFSSIIN